MTARGSSPTHDVAFVQVEPPTRPWSRLLFSDPELMRAVTEAQRTADAPGNQWYFLLLDILAERYMALRREAAAQALEEAATAMDSEVVREPRKWLRARAVALREGAVTHD